MGDIIATSEAQKRAVKKYQKKIKRIPLDVSIEEYVNIQIAAEEAGESVNGYIKKAISIRMVNDKQELIQNMKKWLDNNENAKESAGYKIVSEELGNYENPIEY